MRSLDEFQFTRCLHKSNYQWSSGACGVLSAKGFVINVEIKTEGPS